TIQQAPQWGQAALSQPGVPDELFQLNLADYVAARGFPHGVFILASRTPAVAYSLNDATGEFSFTPSAEGTYHFVFGLTNSAGHAGEFALTVNAAASCVPGEVELVQQVQYYDATFLDGGWIEDSGPTEMRMWGNTYDTPKQAVAWRTFRTSGTGGGVERPLQPGDKFQISFHGFSPYGILGVSLNDGAATGSWADRHSNSRTYIQCGNTNGDLYITYGNLDASSWEGIRPWNTTLTMEFHILSSREFSATIAGQTPKYDLSMLNEPGDTDWIDGFSVYYADDWNGTSNEAVYWKQKTAVTNLGFVEFGADNGTRLIRGKITDGTAATCVELHSPNLVVKKGTGAITLANTNSYSGGTYIDAGTLTPSSASALGSGGIYIGAASGAATFQITSALTLTNPVIIRQGSSGARSFYATADVVLDAPLTVEETTSSRSLLRVASGKTVTVNGVVQGRGALRKELAGTLVLPRANTLTGGVAVAAGRLIAAHADALGGAANAVSVLSGGTLELQESVRVRTLTMSSGSTLQLSAGQTVEAAAASTIGNVVFDVAAASSFDGESSAEWAVTAGAGTAGLASNAVVSVLNAPEQAIGVFRLVVELGVVKVQYVAVPAEPLLEVVSAGPTSMYVDMEVGAGQTVVMVYNTTGTFLEAPAAGTALPLIGASFGGGIVAYVGSGELMELEGLLSCTPYFFKAWTYDRGVWSLQGVTASDSTDVPAAPTGLYVQPTNAMSFTLNWPAVAGAAGYRLDVSTLPSFGAGSAYLVQESFEAGVLPEGWDATGAVSNNTTYASSTGRYASAFSAAGRYVRTPMLSHPGTLTYEYAKTGNATVWISVTEVASSPSGPWQAVHTNQVQNSSAQSGILVGPIDLSAYENIYVRIRDARSSGSAVRYVDEMNVTSRLTGDYVPGYSNRLVQASGVIVDGLEEETTYYYRLRAEGHGECVSPHSATGWVTTIVDADMPTVVLSDNGLQVAATNVQAGTMAHVLHRSRLDVTVNAATLAAVAVTTVGTVEEGDITALHLWRSSSASFSTSTATPIGILVAPGSAGEHTWSGLSEVLAIGTHYLYVTADVATNAIGGRTIGLAALLPTHFTFLNVRKSGETTAGGLQTIWRRPAPYFDPAVTNMVAGTGYSVPVHAGEGVFPATVAYTVTKATASPEPDGTYSISASGTPDGLFQFAPTSADVGRSFQFEVAAVNAAGEASQPAVLTVTVGMGMLRDFVVQPLPGGASVQLSFTPFQSGDDVVIRYSLQAEELVSPLSGGAVAYSGSADASPKTLSGLIACTPYYFAAWEQTGTTYSPLPLSATVTTLEPAEPTRLWAAITYALDFTAQCDAVPVALAYRLDVSTLPSFGAGSAYLVQESFETGVLPEGWDATGTVASNATYASSTGRYAISFSSTNQYVRTPMLSHPETLTYEYAKTANTSVWIAVTEVASSPSGPWQAVHTNRVQNSSLQSGILVGPIDLSAYENIYVRIRDARSSGGAVRYVDEINITSRATGDFVPGYSNLTVTGTSQLVSALEEETVYYFRVKAIGNGGEEC
ncbi:MAG: autotransporter-associated beta strand repeat-containing protein, partial [Verrucomicrobiota bacterium]|nr:autotransporter-associated beta strand repeat-containing protein [Verrucomicrobiota bacterium]